MFWGGLVDLLLTRRVVSLDNASRIAELGEALETSRFALIHV
jgi:hypothetical protein